MTRLKFVTYLSSFGSLLILGNAWGAPSETTRWIEQKYPNSARKRAALEQLAADVAAFKASGKASGPASESSSGAAMKVLESARCVHAMIPDPAESREVTRELNAKLGFELDAAATMRPKDAAAGDSRIELSRSGEGAHACRFDPKKLKD